jgi:menaquinone-dependent protoporphyrinogen oxidase
VPTPLYDRRNFLKLGSQTALMAFAAFGFGCSIKPFIEEKNKKVALIYGTRYGATKDTAQWIAQGLGRDIDLLNIETIDGAQTSLYYDLFIIGSGVWIDGVHKELIAFLQNQKANLNNKIIASFILCGSTPNDDNGKQRIAQYFKKFHAPLQNEPLLHEFFGGRMIIDQLNEKDHKLLEHFYKNVLKRAFVSWDRTEPEKARQFASTTLKYL